MRVCVGGGVGVSECVCVCVSVCVCVEGSAGNFSLLLFSVGIKQNDMLCVES